MRLNPYTPGAGFIPTFLAGRERLIQEAEGYLDGLQNRYPQQSVIYYGLRGVGKTVLLNTLESSAENKGFLHTHIEASETNNFTMRLIGKLNRFLREISAKESARELVHKCTALIKSLTVSYNAEEGTFTMGVSPGAEDSTGFFADDLTEIFVTLGRAALKSDDTICIFVDEVQCLEPYEIRGVITAIHRCNQLRLPIMVFCAGLPKILKTVGEACSYAERLFKFEMIDALGVEESKDAICEPAMDLGVRYSDEAVTRIVEVTAGYPYFIQELCSAVWRRAEDTTELKLADVNQAEEEFFSALDRGFFSVRYDRCTKTEKDFMIAMVRCDELPCTISNVAKILGRTSKSISPCRGQLINKGMIYATSHAEINFTVPQFDNFIRRNNPELKFSV